MFKLTWEKASSLHQLPENCLNQMLERAFPDKKAIAHELISGGCANLNFKVFFENEVKLIILRVYIRDKDAAFREQKLAALLKPMIPVPLIYFVGECRGYHSSVMEYISGISLRELLMSDDQHDVESMMYQVGVFLSKIAKIEFLETGFFGHDLNIISQLPSDDYLTFTRSLLTNKKVLSILAPELISEISSFICAYGHLFPDGSEKHLVHADFDVSNILVDKIGKTWQVTGILDWEFAFSGPVLCDVANMLRYADKMPRVFQEAFLNGLRSGGITLPENWAITTNLLNLMSLLDCLKESDPVNRPNQCSDIVERINYILACQE